MSLTLDTPARHPTLPSRRTEAWRQSFRQYVYIIYALMMHDIKNRFFGSGLGQIVMILWPFVHIVLLIAIYYVTKRPHPFGESLIQYSAVSVFPFIVFNYVSRWICYSAATNKGFLQYPIIRPLDLIVARTLLEIVSITVVALMLLATVVVCGDSARPANPLEAIFATGATVFLSIGWGFFNAAFAFLFPMWLIVVTLIIICMYASSGVLFIASQIPEPYRTYLSYNPLLHCTEWLRIAYYTDYPTSLISRAYVMEFSLVTLTLGIILIKILRRFY